jgi:hypothetical protein
MFPLADTNPSLSVIAFPSATASKFTETGNVAVAASNRVVNNQGALLENELFYMEFQEDLQGL